MVDSDALRARLEEAKENLEMQRSAEIDAETAVEGLQAQWTNAQSYETDATVARARLAEIMQLADQARRSEDAAAGPQAAPLFVIQSDPATAAAGGTIPRRE